MLMTISRSKAGRVQLPGAEASLSWRDVFRGNEDLLTGVVFARFRFLSVEGLQQVMGLLIGGEHAAELGLLEGIEFWPHLTGLSDRSWVEPDVVLTFKNATVLVEVKPPFGGNQYVAQWKFEINAFVAECAQGERQYPSVLHFVALGRNFTNEIDPGNALVDTRGDFELFTHLREWDIFWRWLSNPRECCTNADKAVYDDWQEALRLFGLEDVGPPKTWEQLQEWMTGKSLSFAPYMLRDQASAIAVTRIDQDAGWRALVEYSGRQSLEMCAWT